MKKLFDDFSMFSMARRYKLVPVGVTLAMLTLAVVIPGYVYASNSITPGSVLYPVKQGIEKIEISIAGSPYSKSRVYAKLAQRRLAEVENMVHEQPEMENSKVIAQTIDEAAKLNEEAHDQTSRIADKKEAQKADEIISRSEENNINTMNRVVERVGSSTQNSIEGSISSAVLSFSYRNQQIKNNLRIERTSGKSPYASSTIMRYLEENNVEASNSSSSIPDDREQAMLEPKSTTTPKMLNKIKTKNKSVTPGNNQNGNIQGSQNKATKEKNQLKPSLHNSNPGTTSVDRTSSMDEKMKLFQNYMIKGDFESARNIIKSMRQTRSTSTPMRYDPGSVQNNRIYNGRKNNNNQPMNDWRVRN